VGPVCREHTRGRRLPGWGGSKFKGGTNELKSLWSDKNLIVPWVDWEILKSSFSRVIIAYTDLCVSDAAGQKWKHSEMHNFYLNLGLFYWSLNAAHGALARVGVNGSEHTIQWLHPRSLVHREMDTQPPEKVLIHTGLPKFSGTPGGNQKTVPCGTTAQTLD
jgi:hypothetical protein